MTDGHFDPRFHLHAELPVRSEQTFGGWTPTLGVAPGIE